MHRNVWNESVLTWFTVRTLVLMCSQWDEQHENVLLSHIIELCSLSRLSSRRKWIITPTKSWVVYGKMTVFLSIMTGSCKWYYTILISKIPRINFLKQDTYLTVNFHVVCRVVSVHRRWVKIGTPTATWMKSDHRGLSP